MLKIAITLSWGTFGNAPTSMTSRNPKDLSKVCVQVRRSKDGARGGQGGPVAPKFSKTPCIVVVNFYASLQIFLFFHIRALQKHIFWLRPYLGASTFMIS